MNRKTFAFPVLFFVMLFISAGADGPPVYDANFRMPGSDPE